MLSLIILLFSFVSNDIVICVLKHKLQSYEITFFGLIKGLIPPRLFSRRKACRASRRQPEACETVKLRSTKKLRSFFALPSTEIGGVSEFSKNPKNGWK